MTISSSLNAGVAGLNANATRLATISDNIANSSTYGYKRAEADFHSLVISGNEGKYSAGGVARDHEPDGRCPRDACHHVEPHGYRSGRQWHAASHVDCRGGRQPVQLSP